MKFNFKCLCFRQDAATSTENKPIKTLVLFIDWIGFYSKLRLHSHAVRLSIFPFKQSGHVSPHTAPQANASNVFLSPARSLFHASNVTDHRIEETIHFHTFLGLQGRGKHSHQSPCTHARTCTHTAGVRGGSVATTYVGRCSSTRDQY